MRKNLPVTSNEYMLDDDALIVSKTDTKGKLTYFNEQFVRASGFSEDELIGQPHNIVRHPDMPPAAFQNLWETIQAGKPWSGAVKNRRKNGDFYWVRASATPIWENGQITGYMSVRTRLSAAEREEAERVYALMNQGQAQNYRVDDGIIRKKSWRDLFAPFTRTLRARLTTLNAVLALFMVVIGAAGMLATYNANSRMQSIYEDRTVHLEQLAEINDRMLDNAMSLRGVFIRFHTGQALTDISSRVAANSERIAKVFGEYMATTLTLEEKLIAESFAKNRKAYVEEGIQVGLALAKDAKYDELGKHLTNKWRTLYDAAKSDLDKLVAIQIKEAKADFVSSRQQYHWMMGTSIALILSGVLVGVLLGSATVRAIVGPLGRLNATMANIGQGRLNSQVSIERDDEIGIALRNIQAMQNKLAFDREQEQEVARKTAEQRKQDMHRLANEFESAVGEIIETVSSASTELEASAGTLTSTAERSQELTVAVAAASEQASTNVQSVASATEELTSSVNEISRQVQESARIANEAVGQAQHTNQSVGQLSEAAGKIGAVVELISNIAGQTNLLALNATIEAARAGDAGRGFAVVASEVKALAEQTAKATGEISQQIASIQSATTQSVGAITAITGTINRMSEIASTIASAVEEQGAATQEISRNVQQAAQGTMEVSSNITDVQRGASETGSASSQVLSSAQALAQDSNRLKTEVGRFLNTVRAA
ncbi:MAG: PAS domain S-box protein [Rhodopseudomonas palustris]|nr:MAG: PAS domain S-box protein [Rhodopseudomonas palustris]